MDRLPLLPAGSLDPFDIANTFDNNDDRLSVINSELLQEGLEMGFNPTSDALNAAAELFTINFPRLRAQFEKMPSHDESIDMPTGTKKTIRAQPLHPDQLLYYRKHKSESPPAAFMVEHKRGAPNIPVAASITHLPTAVIEPIQRYLLTGQRATVPGSRQDQPAVRALVPYANPANLEIELAPPFPSDYLKRLSKTPEALRSARELRWAYMQKLAHYNVVAANQGFCQADLANFRRIMTNRMASPPGNFTHCFYYDPNTAVGRLALRRSLKMAYIQGEGVEAIMGVSFKLVCPRCQQLSLKKLKES